MPAKEHGKGKGKRNGHARVHAAVPFAGAQRRQASNSEEKLRSDSVRKAFNSPFWPHVLTTTPIGQEGLDFHVWCDQVVHWDLPRDPVDFEQREGRVARYASLSLRRAMCEEFGPAVRPSSGKSPFAQIFDAAKDTTTTDLGLERWWAPPNFKPKGVTFETQLSLSRHQYLKLQEDLLHYRLALGQPEPMLFEQFVKHFELGTGEARQLALNLSAASR